MQTFKTSKAKENILAKIRKELNTKSLAMPYPDVEKRKEGVYASEKLSDEELFATNFNDLGGKFIFCEDETEMAENIISLCDSRGWKKILCSEQYIRSHFNNNEIVVSADMTDPDAEACITGCEAAIARTGSVIISSKQNMGRTSTIFYPVHIIIARASQVVSDIQNAVDLMKDKYGKEMPSMINLNTGPSRTADIEKTLVVGIHGPGEVFCFLLNN